MGNYNKVLLMGNLTRDVELKYTPAANMAVANIGIAVNRRYKAGDGELKEEVTFVDCEAWGSTAENISKYFSKGKPIFVEGRLKLDQWQDKEGGNRSKLKVVVENFQFVDSKAAAAADGQSGGGSGGGGGYSRPQGAPQRTQPAYSGSSAPAAQAGGAQHDPIPDDEIPF